MNYEASMMIALRDDSDTQIQAQVATANASIGYSSILTYVYDTSKAELSQNTDYMKALNAFYDDLESGDYTDIENDLEESYSFITGSGDSPSDFEYEYDGEEYSGDELYVGTSSDPSLVSELQQRINTDYQVMQTNFSNLEGGDQQLEVSTQSAVSSLSSASGSTLNVGKTVAQAMEYTEQLIES